MKRKNGKMLRGGFDWTFGLGKKSNVEDPSTSVQPPAQPSTSVQQPAQPSTDVLVEGKKGLFGGKKHKSQKNKKTKSQKKR